MDVPISEIDIEYLIDAAEKTFRVEEIPEYVSFILFKKDPEKLKKRVTAAYNADLKPALELLSKLDAAERTYVENQRYISYILFQEAEKTLENLKKQVPSETYKELEDRIRDDLSDITDKGIDIPERPEDYGENESIIEVLVQFYSKYIEDKKIDEIREEDEKHKKWGTLSPNFQELEGRSAMRERILTTSKALRTALKMLSRVEPQDRIKIRDEDTKYDEEGSNETCNIIPFDGRPHLLPEVNYAIDQLKLAGARLFSTGEGDVLNRLEKIFKFQEDNVSNQRENIVNLLSNEQMRLGEHERALDKVFLNTFENYTNWCLYLSEKPIWESTNDGKKILYISLYYLIWGEAANVRFLPECLCYIFHRMSRKVDDYLRPASQQVASQQVTSQQSDDQNVMQVPQPYEGSFIEKVIQPLYDVIAAEAKINSKRDAPHSTWRNYDDFNEYFWSPDCLKPGLCWPLNEEPDRNEPDRNEPDFLKMPSRRSTVKTSFVEHRTFLHLYHSFHRMWILHVMILQALVIFAFNDEKLNSKTLREILSVGPTYFLMKLIQSMLDIVLKYGAYSNTSCGDVLRILFRFIWFMLATYYICFLYMKCLQEMTSSIEESIGFKIYVTVLGIYAVFKISFSILSQFLSKKYENFLLALYLEEEYVGRAMAKELPVYIMYMIFWLVILAINIAYTYPYLIWPLVRPTRDITNVSQNIYNMLAIGSLWAGVICAYITSSHIIYNVASAVVGSHFGHKDGIGKIKSLDDVGKWFDSVPKEFMDHLNISESPPVNNQEDVSPPVNNQEDVSPPVNNQEDVSPQVNNQVQKKHAEGFTPFWNQIVMNLREEDYISDSEQYALSMPKKSTCIDVIQWPPFLLVGKVSRAIKIAAKPISQKVMWDRISRDVYMKYAVKECFHSVKFILCQVLDNEGKTWVHRIYEGIKISTAAGRYLGSEFQLNQLENFVKKISELIEALNKESRHPTPTEILEAKYAAKKLYVHRNSRHPTPTEILEPTGHPELRSQIRRLHVLLNVKDHVPRNREARRRLEFFTNSLFMSMPTTKPVREMLSFSVLTPYYKETVLYSLDELKGKNDDGVTHLDYLKNLYPDEWTNYCERVNKRDTHDGQILELRLWASYRGQTLARTVRGTMYYQKALLLQAYTEMLINRGLGVDVMRTSGSDVSMDEGSHSLDECLDRAKAYVDLKFTYVVSCQKYGKQKKEAKKDREAKQKDREAEQKDREAKQLVADIKFLLKKNEGLRVAYIDENENKNEENDENENENENENEENDENENENEENEENDENEKKVFYSKLVKADKNGEEMEVYSIKLPGDPRLGEGKPENQNHAIVFTRGNAIQTIDMNQDNYFEETLKMRNLLEEFHSEHGIPPTILGIREHIFSGSASYLASFMSHQETGFVTLGQRVMAKPLNVRMHYGHPDVFDRVFHITRGGISKASRGINISEDIYAGFNSTLRMGRVTHHEYIQVGKGRDVGFNQISIFEGKVAGGNGEQVLSRDMYRLGQRFDFFRMLSFYYTSVGYYFSSLLMVITLYILLYGNLIMALSGTRVPHVLNDTNLTIWWLLPIVLLPAIYMVLVLILEQGYEKAVESFLTMFSRLCSIFFAFSLGTRNHWFGRTIIHGGASYQATGRGFVLHHIGFSENYMLYSRSHFVKGMEVLFLLVVYGIYGFHPAHAFYNNLLLLGGLILSFSWILAPFLFDGSPFHANRNTEDQDDWNRWLNRKSVEVKSTEIEDKVKESWEIWWDKELSYIQTPTGRVIETILCLRFFIFLYVVIYKIYVQGSIMSLLISGFLSLFVVILFANKVVLSNKTDRVNVYPFIGALAIAFFTSHVGDMLAFIIAFITTLWGILLICVAWKPKLVTGLAKICDAGMGTLMFYIASMFSYEFIKRYLVRNMFPDKVSDYLRSPKGPNQGQTPGMNQGQTAGTNQGQTE